MAWGGLQVSCFVEVLGFWAKGFQWSYSFFLLSNRLVYSITYDRHIPERYIHTSVCSTNKNTYTQRHASTYTIMCTCTFLHTYIRATHTNTQKCVYTHIRRQYRYISVGLRLQSPSFMVLIITKHMWLFVLIKFKLLNLFQGSKYSRGFFLKRKVLKTPKRLKYGIKTQYTQTILIEKPDWRSCSHLEPCKRLVC